MSQMNIATVSSRNTLTLPDTTSSLAAAFEPIQGDIEDPTPAKHALNVSSANEEDETEEIPFDRRSQQVPSSQTERRKSLVNRRLGLDRRVVDIGSPTGLERRRGPGRRRTDDRRSAEEGEMTDEQFEFMLAVDTYKRLNNRPFPTWTEVLEVVKQLGYRKVAQSTITLSKATGRSV